MFKAPRRGSLRARNHKVSKNFLVPQHKSEKISKTVWRVSKKPTHCQTFLGLSGLFETLLRLCLRSQPLLAWAFRMHESGHFAGTNLGISRETVPHEWLRQDQRGRVFYGSDVARLAALWHPPNKQNKKKKKSGHNHWTNKSRFVCSQRGIICRPAAAGRKPTGQIIPSTETAVGSQFSQIIRARRK